MEQIFIELAKHSPLALLLGGVLWVGSRILERQLEISNAQRTKEIDSTIRASEKELEILEVRHESATHHEEQMEQIAKTQSGLLERISASLERLANR